MIELLVLGVLLLALMVVFGVLAGVFSLLFWIVALPFKLLGLALKGVGMLLVLPVLAVVGAVVIFTLGIGLFVAFLPLLPLIAGVWLVWWLLRRDRAVRVTSTP